MKIKLLSCILCLFTLLNFSAYGQESENLDTLGNDTEINRPHSVERILIYPIPADAFLNIEILNTEIYTSVEIYDMFNNRVLTSSTINTKIIKLNIASLSKGIYFVSIHNDDGLFKTRKIIIE